MNKSVRVRFAPSPTGLMHLGNVRTALMNALFAKKNSGSFIVRIEDTDLERLVDPEAKKILENLAWLNLFFDEGPFFQSKRTELYQKHLDILIKKGRVYRCFKTKDELEDMRQKQIDQGLPPRYDCSGLQLSNEDVQKNLKAGKPFIWRFRLPKGSVTINDLARGPITFDLEHFADFPLTRQDGSFTFTFANFVDDFTMGITDVFRGEDHLTNTANQAALYQAFETPLPNFYHMPLLCNAEGKKLSKRDFGFSLEDLRSSGFLPEAICNYLAIIGGSFKKEIMDFDELVQAIQFNTSSPTSAIRYDVEKLRWVNQQWINNLSVDELVKRIKPFVEKAYPKAQELSAEQWKELASTIQTDLVTLCDTPELLAFFFEEPPYTAATLDHHSFNDNKEILTHMMQNASKNMSAQDFFESIKQTCKKEKASLKHILALVRIALTGNASGLGIVQLFTILGTYEAQRRIQKMLHKN